MANLNDAKNVVVKQKLMTVADFFEQKKSLIAQALPKTITPERLIGIFTMILRTSPKLMECSQNSLIGAVIQTVQLGLQPGNIGHIHLIPFNNKGTLECQLVIGYKGFVELVNRSGRATILTAEVVYANDQFEYEQGLNPILKHKPANGDRGEKIGVYCIAKNLLASEKVFVYIQKEEIEKIRKASKSQLSEYSPWNTWAEEMWKKTAVKRISKLLPLSAESMKSISADETIKTEIVPDMIEVEDRTVWEEDAEGKKIESTTVAPTGTGKARVTAIDVQIFNLKKQINNDKAYYNILGSVFGVEHMTQLTGEQKIKFIELLTKESNIQK